MIYFSIISFLNVKIGNKKVVEKKERERDKNGKITIYIDKRTFSLFYFKGKYIYHVDILLLLRFANQITTTSNDVETWLIYS